MPWLAYHYTFDVAWALAQPPDDMTGLLLTPDGTPLGYPAIAEVLRAAQELGWEVYPCCDHTDERGYCLGHPLEEVLL